MSEKNKTNQSTIEPFKVYVRIRPFLPIEISQLNTISGQILDSKQLSKKSILQVENNNTCYLQDPNDENGYGKNIKAFPFNHIFTEKDDNKLIFEKIIKKLVDNILLGFNSTALAYGVTGTGKTHTMFGDIYQNNNSEKGICIYAVEYLFNKLNLEKQKFLIKISYLEIYNEQVIDLLTETQSNEGIMIIEDPNKGVIVPELTEKIVIDSGQVLNYLKLGNKRRTMGSTGINQFSSRSHAIMEINIEQKTKNKNKEEIINSKLLFVDLAGSEKGGMEKGIRREEGSNINKSLLALGKSINILADKSKKGSFVPYRDSKLTRLLKDSLGGNISTIMIACVSPSPLSYEETNSTLKYATRANKIEKKVTKNIRESDQYTSQYKEIISSLKNEISQLKDIIKNQHLLMKLKPSEKKIINNENEDNILYDDFFNADEMLKLENNNNFLDISINKDDDTQKVLNCNFDAYENILNSNLDNLRQDEFEDFEKKMEGLYFDKIALEDKIRKGIKDTEINEKYNIIRTFYEKFIELINDKLIENIEQNLILKFNLKEILELNETNNSNLNKSLEQFNFNNKDEKIKDEIENYKKIICDNEKEKKKIEESLENNLKIKNFLEKLLFKFISNTQMKDIRELKDNYITILNEKLELEIKNKKYQEFLITVMREKEEKSQKIFELSHELDKLKRQLIGREKRIKDLYNKLRNLENICNNNSNNNIHSNHSSGGKESNKKKFTKKVK
jgi:kinesin family protein 18/19